MQTCPVASGTGSPGTDTGHPSTRGSSTNCPIAVARIGATSVPVARTEGGRPEDGTIQLGFSSCMPEEVLVSNGLPTLVRIRATLFSTC